MYSYRATDTVFFGVLCSLLGVRGLGLATALVAAGAGVVTLIPYFFGATKRLGDCKFLLAAIEGVVLKKRKYFVNKCIY